MEKLEEYTGKQSRPKDFPMGLFCFSEWIIKVVFGGSLFLSYSATQRH